MTNAKVTLLTSSENPARNMFSVFKRFAQGLFFLAGLALFIWVLRATGLERLKLILPALGYGGWTVFLYFGIMNFLDSMAWLVLYPAGVWHRLSAWNHFFLIRVAGEAINNLTPFADVGGEFLKVTLASDVLKTSRKAAVISVILTRSTLFFSEVFFWITGFLPILFFVTLSGPTFWLAVVTIFVSLGLSLALVILQRRGFLRSFVELLNRFGVQSSFLKKSHLSIQEIDEGILSFYRHKIGEFWASFFLHWLGWIAGGLETYWMFRILGSPIDPWQAVAGEAFFQLVKSGSFFIPANLGAQEAGLGWYAGSLGLHPSYGVLVSLLKRARQLVWTAIGFVIWGGYCIMAPSKTKVVS